MLYAVAGAVLFTNAAVAQNATAPLDIATYSIGPAVVALGGAGASWPHDASGTLNPSTIANAPRLSVYHFEGFADYGGTYVAGSARIRSLAVGVSIRHQGWERVIEDDLGIPTDGLKSGETQYSGTLAIEPLHGLHFGFAVTRFVSDNLGVRVSATSWSVGSLIRYDKGGHFGLALLHAGKPVDTRDGQSYALPTTLRVGLSHRVWRGMTIVLDGAWPRNTRDWTAHVGAEWRAWSVLALRAGLESSSGGGAGVREARFASGVGIGSGPLEVTLTTRFGGMAGSQEWFVGLDLGRLVSTKEPSRN